MIYRHLSFFWKNIFRRVKLLPGQFSAKNTVCVARLHSTKTCKLVNSSVILVRILSIFSLQTKYMNVLIQMLTKLSNKPYASLTSLHFQERLRGQRTRIVSKRSGFKPGAQLSEDKKLGMIRKTQTSESQLNSLQVYQDLLNSFSFFLQISRH